MDIKEALEKLQKREKTDLISLIRKFKKEGIETFAITKLEIIETVLAELEKKDKIINEMAKYIARIDIEEDICMNNLANTELCNEECSNCVECIKEYFKKKVEE